MLLARVALGGFWCLNVALEVGDTPWAAGYAAPATCAAGLYLLGVVTWGAARRARAAASPSRRRPDGGGVPWLVRAGWPALPLLAGLHLYFMGSGVAEDSAEPGVSFLIAGLPLLPLALFTDTADRPAVAAGGSRRPPQPWACVAVLAPLACTFVLLLDLFMLFDADALVRGRRVHGFAGDLRGAVFAQLLPAAVAGAAVIEGLLDASRSRARLGIPLAAWVMTLGSWRLLLGDRLRAGPDAGVLASVSLVPLALLVVCLAARGVRRGAARAWLAVPVAAPVVQHLLAAPLAARHGWAGVPEAGHWALGGSVLLLLAAELPAWRRANVDRGESGRSGPGSAGAISVSSPRGGG